MINLDGRLIGCITKRFFSLFLKVPTQTLNEKVKEYRLDYFKQQISLSFTPTNIYYINIFLLIFSDAQNFRCPDKDGQYEDPIQCDKYYECVDGVAKEKLCPDGLVFDPTLRKINKCDQPFNVDCGDRQELREFEICKLFKLIQCN